MSPKPFICRFPRCEASYCRQEHRRRHEAQHDQDRAIKCATCDQKFSRRDTLRRHMQKVHGVKEPARMKFACTRCRNQKVRCEEGPPCSNCRRHRIQCSLSKSVEVQQSGLITCPTESLSLVLHHTPAQSKRSRSEKQKHFIDLYFKLFHPYWPFIHQGSFRKYDQAPLLVQSVVVIGLWLSNEDNARPSAIALHNVLSSAIHEQKELWDVSNSEDACSACFWPIPTYQAILLHIIFAVLYKGSGALGLDLKPCLTPADADLLDRLVQSCKKLGMMYYPNMLAQYYQSDLPAYVCLSIEEVKRFNITLYRVCKMCSKQESLTDHLNSTRMSSTGLCATDLQFPLPRNTSLWKAVNEAEWASAATENVYHHRLEDTLEGEWISRSANVLELL